ncbi:hypothetical protein PAMP_020909 [Pampus punctatissimus]
MANLERNNKILLDLMQQPGNNLCADCGAPDPDWASYTLGIFVCLNCSGMHRNLPAVSKVKSIRLDRWEDSLVESMRERGNSAAKAVYEKCVPAFFYRPQQKDCVVLKDQWIRAKYERREFTGENNYFQQTYNSDLFESTLWKKGKDNKQFFKRSFQLSRKDFTLKYFIKEDVIVSLFNAIRATRLEYLQRKNPTLREDDDATELGAVFIGTESHSYSVSENSSRSTRGGRWHCGITLQTPERQFVFMCEQEQDKMEWLEAFRKVISQPMTPEDYASGAC